MCTCMYMCSLQVKILKRPVEKEAGDLSSEGETVESTSNQHKTFAQREAEYASARYMCLVFGVLVVNCISVDQFTSKEKVMVSKQAAE